MVEVQKTVDSWFARLLKEAGQKISTFVAFIFFIMAIGVFIGVIVMEKYPDQAVIAILLPALAGAIAYYNRAFALVLFVLLILMLFIL